MPAGAAFACLGECMVELRARPDGLLSRAFGGDTLNTALYLARLGVGVDYVTALGDDDLSGEMLAAWAAEGIGTAHVRRVPGRLPGLYLIETDGRGERRFLHWREAAPVRRLFDPDEADATEAALAQSQRVYLSGITLSLFAPPARARLVATLTRLRAAGGHVVFDTNYRPRGWPDPAEAWSAFAEVIALSHTVFASVEDMAHLTGEAAPEAILARLDGAGVAEAVVKLDRPACLVRHGGCTEAVPAAEVAPVLDTTAAGDSFAAGYLAARLAGRDPPAAARAGHRLAGAVVRHPGAIIPRAAMPAPEDPA